MITIFALFGDDFRSAVTNKSADYGFSGAFVAIMGIFFLEIILSCISKPEYPFSFFFWLDILSTVSLIFDVIWVYDLIQGNNSFTNSSQVARASRASRAGTRAVRIIRIIRVIRLIRIVKLYKIAQARLKNKQGALLRSLVTIRGNPAVNPLVIDKKPPKNDEDFQEDSMSQYFESFSDRDNLGFDAGLTPDESTVNRRLTSIKRTITIVGNERAEVPKESRVGKKLSDLTTERVIILVLILVLLLPFFDIGMYNQIDSYEFGLQVINSYINRTDGSREFWFDEYKNKYQPLSPSLIFLQVDNTNLTWNSSDPGAFRTDEITITTLSAPVDYEYLSIAVVDMSSQTSLQAGLNMLNTFFICLVLAVSSILLSKDTNELVIEPLENMIQTVKDISTNPLTAVQNAERKALIQEEANETNFYKRKKDNKILETEILEKLIIKIGALMALGFGEAGSTIIAKNMEHSKGDVDPMVPGKRQLCIFGFCDIRFFSDVTEALEQDIMFFVNEIAFYVHKHVDECLGATNKNLGDVFVLVWKFPDKVITKDKNKNKVLLENHPFIPQFSDLAIISFAKIISEIKRNPALLKYNDNPIILETVPNFKVKMGFGLHFGWGIEGAIGSEYKIDASYLSPNVNLSSRLCAATKHYGVWMLISQQVHGLLSEKMKTMMRKVDRVTFKGSAEPMNIFTLDLNTDHLSILENKPTVDQKNKKKARVNQRIEREELEKDLWSGTFRAVRIFKENEELKDILLVKNPEFVSLFENAVEDYLNGRWKVAKKGFVEALALKEGDGPCQNLIHFIEEYNETPPASWNGYRKLLEK